MKPKINTTKLSAYLHQAGALSKNIKPAKVAAYGALGAGMITLPVVPTLGQCGTADYVQPNLDINGGGNDFSFTFYAAAIYMTRLGGWQALTNGSFDGGYPFLRNANGLNLTTATTWSSGKIPTNAYLLHKNGPLDDFNVGTSGFVGVRTNPGLVYGFFQVTIINTLPTPPNLTIDESQSGMDGNPGSPPIGGDCVSMGTSLPVELSGFFAKLAHDNIQLTWATASETNNAGFEIQRSLDGRDFEKIGWADGRGNTYSPQEYSFEDENIKPATEYYYRLKQTDMDGQFEYSPVLGITTLGNGTIISDAYPNPSKDGEVHFPFNASADADWTATVFSAQGVELHQQKQLVPKGESNFTLSLGDLPKGAYFIKLENKFEQVYRKINLF